MLPDVATATGLFPQSLFPQILVCIAYILLKYIYLNCDLTSHAVLVY